MVVFGMPPVLHCRPSVRWPVRAVRVSTRDIHCLNNIECTRGKSKKEYIQQQQQQEEKEEENKVLMKQQIL